LSYQEFPPLLPKGFHSKLLHEIIDICVTPFQNPERRKYLYDRFEQLHGQLVRFGIHLEIWVNGSYLTEKPDPQDIDMVVLLPQSSYIPSRVKDLIRDLTLRHNEIRARYSCDLFFAPSDSLEARNKWGILFGRSKGIIVINIH
jgi:hypothetical protein